MNTSKQQRVADTLVSLADTLVDDFDLLDYLGLLAEKTRDHLDVAAAAVVLSDQRGGWHPTATSDETPELVALFAADGHHGPCRDCVATAAPVATTDLAAKHQQWPGFAEQAHQAGYRAAAAVPMRSHHHIIGSLAVLSTSTEGLDEPSLRLAQSLADMATIGLLQRPTAQRGDLLAEQLQAVLHHRLVLEQAKGVLIEYGHLTPQTAYTCLRDYARHQGLHLSELARQVATYPNGTALDIILDNTVPTPHS